MLNYIDSFVRQLNVEYPNSGYREMTQLLKHRHNLSLPRYRVMESLRRVDPVGAAGRWALVITRRTYTATSANSCWHLDTQHSLIKCSDKLLSGDEVDMGEIFEQVSDGTLWFKGALTVLVV